MQYPLIKTAITDISPGDLFDSFKDEPHSFFLDSGMDANGLGRFSFMGSDPFLLITSRGDQISISRGAETEVVKGNPFDVLNDLLEQFRIKLDHCPVPFIGGAVGYFSYDLCHFIEKLPGQAVDDLTLPESYFGFYDAILAYDHYRKTVSIISTGFPETTEEEKNKKAHRRLQELDKKISKAAVSKPFQEPASVSLPPSDFKCNFSHRMYLEAVEKSRQYIIAGDIFEVNISQRFETELNTSPYDLYRILRHINPAPFACYLNFEGLKILSSSPERFLQLRGNWVETRPIKGTRPRGKTPETDAAYARELTTSTKDRAENIMIVDLERNDLGRVCRYGSVKVTGLTELEKFPSVYHLTSTVEGKLKKRKSGMDLLKATFPGGSITGAPKIRAMEIIDEIEPTRRSIYTGNIGYLGFNGDIDLNIAIRTILVKDNKAYFQVGGAVVYDSDPEEEYQETLDKARALFEAFNRKA